MNIYNLFKSLYCHLKIVFKKKHYKILFYSPQHFNRGKNNENLFFKDLFDYCNKNNISFLFLEEPDLKSKHKRSKKAVPFDFIYYLIVLLRKLIYANISQIEKDKKIGRLLKYIFFRNITFDNYITISQSMLSFFNGVHSDARSFDLQHGIIHKKHNSYMINGYVSDNLQKNDTFLLVSGEYYKKILLQNDQENYFSNHAIVIGSYKNNYIKAKTSKLNKNVLVSLQFTDDHSKYENKVIADLLFKCVENNSSFHFYLKHHPRYNNTLDLSGFNALTNISFTNANLEDIFKRCAFHLTSYSTVTFEAGLNGIPTSFLNSDSIRNFISFKEFGYPFCNYSLTDLYDNYKICSLKTKSWAKKYYTTFDNKNFHNSLKNV